MPTYRLLASVCAAAVAALALAGCGAPAAAPGGKLAVVAAENFWGDIAAQIGGDRVAVTSIISDPSTDPHTFETDPASAAAISTARLVIENGLGYDGFIDKILGTGGAAGRRVLSVQKVLGLRGSTANPHVWYDTAALPGVAAAIARELAALEPAHRAQFRANVIRFDRSLRPLLAVIAEIRRKYAGTAIGYTERVPEYLVHAAGLRLGTPASFAQALESGNDPSPQDAAAFDAAITGHRVKVLLYNSQVVDALSDRIRLVAQDAGVPVVGVSETMPSGQHFQDWQLAQDRALLRALGG